MNRLCNWVDLFGVVQFSSYSAVNKPLLNMTGHHFSLWLRRLLQQQLRQQRHLGPDSQMILRQTLMPRSRPPTFKSALPTALGTMFAICALVFLLTELPSKVINLVPSIL